MPECDCAAARCQSRTHDDAYVNGADEVLGSNGNDVGSGDAVLPIEEEAREVLAVGEPNQRVQDPGAAATVGNAFLGELKRAPGLNEAHFVDGDGVGLGSG